MCHLQKLSHLKYENFQGTNLQELKEIENFCLLGSLWFKEDIYTFNVHWFLRTIEFVFLVHELTFY